MNVVRARVKQLTDDQLWEIFGQGDAFEATGVVPEDALLRTTAAETTQDNAMAMMFVLGEVWRELALRQWSYLEGPL